MRKHTKPVPGGSGLNLRGDEMNYCKEIITAMVSRIKDSGLRVFIAEAGTYGFFTDSAGTRVVSFQCRSLQVSFSGNYKTNDPGSTGNGWRIMDHDAGGYRNMLDAHPPAYAVGESKWEFTTLAQHVETYQPSSRYIEV